MTPEVKAAVEALSKAVIAEHMITVDDMWKEDTEWNIDTFETKEALAKEEWEDNGYLIIDDIGAYLDELTGVAMETITEEKVS